jgi:hypothetical protein
MVKTLELAITKAATLPDAAQEQLGHELLGRIDALDIADVIRRANERSVQ